jgi:hypothetical protein
VKAIINKTRCCNAVSPGRESYLWVHLFIFLKIKNMKALLALAFIMIASLVKANDSIIVKKDPRLDVLSVKQNQYNQRMSMMLPNGLYRGFRIQVISTSKRDDAFQMKADLENRFPNEKTYIIFQSPSFKVRIGNFIKKEEANKFKTELNKIFPNGVYIVDDAVEYILKEEEDPITQ